MVDKRPIGYIPGKAYVLDKKVPKSPKYAHIGPSIDTGRHANHIKVVTDFPGDKCLLNKKFELFKRIKASTVANLILKEAHAENICNLVADSESVSGMSEPYNNSASRSVVSHNDYYSDSISRYQYQPSEASKLSVVTYGTEQLGINDNTEFIILDLREKEDYDNYHIREAINFPGPAIARDKFPTILLSLKNKEDKLIIVYHNDEKHGIPYATGLLEKGFDNTYLLSGGIEAFLEKCPELIEGRNIPSPAKKTKSNVIYKRSRFMEYPNEGDVVIPSNYLIEDNKSLVSQVTSKTGVSKSKTFVSSVKSK